MQVVRKSLQPGASVAGVALTHGLNANMVRRWRRKAERGELVSADAMGFIPLEVRPQSASIPQSTDPSSSAIEVEVHRGAIRARIRWPVRAGADCAAWLRELLR